MTDHPGSRAARFRAMHDALFLMPNAWDAASARLLAEQAPAIGTSSAAAAAVLGLRDGERIGRSGALSAAAAVIAAADPTPVNVDLEAGFGDTPEAVADVVGEAIGLGAAGVNLEDTDPATGELRDAGLQAEIVAASAEAIARHDPDVVLNARTDVFWNGVGAPEDRPAHARARLEAYLGAGATCLFVPGFVPTTAESLAEVVGGWSVPVNLLAAASLGLSTDEVEGAGVRRISFGSSLYRAALAHAAGLVSAVADSGTFAALSSADALTYGRLSEVVAR
ncbi:isocitrate lyase/phosphoenolpyruvate mutase family protein [Actinomycetospora endophytica]|uniref:Isocitrate lyase/phosphoenolpyruvate mutase family protein n=1 Tax=Actinomycetospora endophytica TaxID=2291215 RepID=A0ABS8PCF2_9PSEU|nr:isocitrate lyase/phosphoenolpyruvate mutase family protein [Actinomycetospora endophytica]MCD2195966.1 isocitrate lyase/phosphoenolpyruvate mutase family protein [Actinomycetospora endophytica]